MEKAPDLAERLVVGRYELHSEFASGGMATVHLGRLLGHAGFSRTVAIKRLLPSLTRDPDFVKMFLDEARLCARIRHPNVVPTLDVVAEDNNLLLVMEYVEGESLARLLSKCVRAGARVPLPVAVSVMCGVLHGLHAAHEARDPTGWPLGIVHRDVSPQNVLVGTDGVARVLDFGIAKARGRLHTTLDKKIKGKLSYMAPEQIQGGDIDRRSDIFAASILLWEIIAARRLFDAKNEADLLDNVLNAKVPRLSKIVAEVPREIDAIARKGLERDPQKRFQTAQAMALRLESTIPPATSAQVGAWVETFARDALADRAARVQKIEVLSNGGLDDVLTSMTADQGATTVPLLPSAEAASAFADTQEAPSVKAPPTESVTAPCAPAPPPSSEPVAPPTPPSEPSAASGPPDGTTSSGIVAGVRASQGPAAGSEPWRLRTAYGLAALAFLVVAAAVTALAMPRLRTTSASTAPPSVDVPAAAEAPPAAAAASAARVVKVTVTAVPSSAQIYIDDVLVAGNPYTASVTGSSTPHRVRAEAKGFASKETTVAFDDPDVTVKLQLVRAGAKPVTPRPKSSSGPSRTIDTADPY